MRGPTPTLAEFATIIGSVAPGAGRVAAENRLGADLGLDLLALSELDVVLFERYGGGVGFGPARADLLALTVGEAHALCLGREHESARGR